MEENGIEPIGDLTSFPAIGDANAIASLIIIRREKETQNQGSRKLEDVTVSPDGKELSFRLRTEIEVQKPELLLEQYGVSELYRITVAKATLNSNDGNLMGKFFCKHFLTISRSSSDVSSSTKLYLLVRSNKILTMESMVQPLRRR